MPHFQVEDSGKTKQQSIWKTKQGYKDQLGKFTKTKPYHYTKSQSNSITQTYKLIDKKKLNNKNPITRQTQQNKSFDRMMFNS